MVVEVDEPCFQCESLLFAPACLYPIKRPGFDFARDLTEMNHAAPRPNPRI